MVNNDNEYIYFSALLLSSPACPNWYKSATISSQFAEQLSYGQIFHCCSLLRILFNLPVYLIMGSFLIVVVKLYSYKDSDVGNIRKTKYFHG